MHRLSFMIPDDTVKYILIDVIEIGQEQAPFVVFCLFIPSFEHAKNLLIMGPNNTKNSSKSVIFSYLTMNDIVRILLL
jgi:hypothetical protein